MFASFLSMDLVFIWMNGLTAAEMRRSVSSHSNGKSSETRSGWMHIPQHLIHSSHREWWWWQRRWSSLLLMPEFFQQIMSYLSKRLLTCLFSRTDAHTLTSCHFTVNIISKTTILDCLLHLCCSLFLTLKSNVYSCWSWLDPLQGFFAKMQERSSL